MLKNVERAYSTSGREAVKGGIPVINSKRIIPTDHQSAA